MVFSHGILFDGRPHGLTDTCYSRFEARKLTESGAQLALLVELHSLDTINADEDESATPPDTRLRSPREECVCGCREHYLGIIRCSARDLFGEPLVRRATSDCEVMDASDARWQAPNP